MSAAEKINEEINEISEKSFLKKSAVIFGSKDFIQKNIQNRLKDDFNLSVSSFSKLEDGLNHLIENSISILIIDFDSINSSEIRRVTDIVNYTQTPTLLLASKKEHITLLSKESKMIKGLMKEDLNKNFQAELQKLIDDNGFISRVKARLLRVSNNRKPLGFYLLASLLLCEPLIKILFMKFSTGFEFETVLRTITSIEGATTIFEFWFMFPIAGIALITEKSWSFLVFALVQSYCLYSYFHYTEFSWPYVAESPHISSTFLTFINSAFILYFLVPENRRPYWNRSQQLWRDTSRFATHLPAYFQLGLDQVDTTITNISKSGAYFQSKEKLKVNQHINLQVIIAGEAYEFQAIVKRCQETFDEKLRGYGLCFRNLSNEDILMIEEYIGSLNKRIQ